VWPSEVEILGVGFPKKIPGFNGLKCVICAYFLFEVSMVQLYMALCFEAGFMNLINNFKAKC
jgi:hypothetical protein